MSKEKRNKILKITYSGVCLALAYVLPFMTGQIPKIGNMLSPMHIPVFLSGFLCGWQYGLIVGFVAPLLRSLTLGMPPFFPKAISMAFELATYGFLSGVLYKKLPKKNSNIYLTLVVSMISGRIVWGISRFLCSGIQKTQFGFEAFIAGAITDSIPGIIIQIVIIPLLIIVLRKASLTLNE